MSDAVRMVGLRAQCLVNALQHKVESHRRFWSLERNGAVEILYSSAQQFIELYEATISNR